MRKPLRQRFLSVERLWVTSTLSGGVKGFLHFHSMEPIVTEKRIYQGNGTDAISAYDRNSGRLLWRFKLDGGIAGAAVLFDKNLYFGANDGYFYSLRAENGEIEWSISTKTESLGSPFVDENTVYFLSGRDTLYAIDRKTSRQKWLYARQNTRDMSIRAAGRPLVHNSMIYAGFTDGALVALDAQSGQLKWEKQLSSNKRFRDLDASPIRDGNHLYISSYDGHLFCLDLKTGKTIWKAEGGGHTPVTIEGKNLYYSSSNGSILALDKLSGKEIWRFNLEEGIASQPKTFKGLLIFGDSQGSLILVDIENGSKKKQYDPGRGVTSTPYIDGQTGELYFISAAANLFALKVGWKRKNQIWPWE